MRERVLIVEDEAIPALELQMRLEQWGYEVLRTEEKGEAAIAQARAERPDLIIMDIILADAIGGVEAADAIQETQDIPILFITAINYRPPQMPANKSRLVLSKPYNPDDLYNALTSLLGHTPRG